MKSFVHLHLHSEYSLLDGTIQFKPLIERVKKLSMPAVAVTDHGGMMGTIGFYEEALKGGREADHRRRKSTSPRDPARSGKSPPPANTPTT